MTVASDRFPDDTPRPAANGVGGLKDGRALRHADGTEPAEQNFGWLKGVKGVIGSPNRFANGEVNIGPSGKLWRKPQSRFTTGDQRKR
jgi:hypothetical protein